MAVLLRDRFGAQRVVAFGSLVHPGFFSERSDVDLAVSGIPPAAFFKAWAAAGAGCPFALDLVDRRDCSPALRDAYERLLYSVADAYPEVTPSTLHLPVQHLSPPLSRPA